MQSIIWLQNYITSFPSTVLVVAHDFEFVDAVSDEIVILRQQKLLYFEGNLSQYQINENKKRKGLLKMQSAIDKKKQAVEKSIEESKRSARKTGDDNRARMAKSKQKKLDERWGLERSDKGTRSFFILCCFFRLIRALRFKINRDLAGYHTTRRSAVEVEETDPPINLSFPNPEPLRFPGSLISADHVSFKYPGSSKNVVQNLTMTVQPGSRVGLLGLNGRGKSTIVKLLVGALQPSQGEVKRHSRLRIGYYAQHSVEELSYSAVASQPALDYFQEKIKKLENVEINEGLARACLGSFGLGKKATLPVGVLSGGQKVMLLFCTFILLNTLSGPSGACSGGLSSSRSSGPG